MPAPLALWGQQYTAADSITVFRLLEASENAPSPPLSMEYARQAKEKSIRSGMLRGEGFAELRLAYLTVEETPNANVRLAWNRAIEIGAQLQDNYMLALAAFQQGKYAMYNQDYEAAQRNFDAALRNHFEKAQTIETAALYNDLGLLETQMEKPEKAVQYYLYALRLYDRLAYPNGWAMTAGNLSNLFFKQGNLEDALDYARQALSIYEQHNNYMEMATTSGNLCNMYMNTGKMDSAEHYLQKSIRYADYSGMRKHLAQNQMNLSLLYHRQGKFREAFNAIQQSIKVSREIHELPLVASKTRFAALLAGKMGDTTTMNELYDAAYKLADSLNRREVIRDIYAGKANYFEQQKAFDRAYPNLVQYHAIKDSLAKAGMQARIAEMQLQYETEKKDYEIAKLNTEQRIKQIEIEKQKAVIAGNLEEARRKQQEILLLAERQKRKDAEFKRQQELLEKQILEARANEQELQLAEQKVRIIEQENALQEKQLNRQTLLRNISIAGMLLLLLLGWMLFNRYQLRKRLQEKEALLAIRRNISKDLHDEIGSSLTNINILNELAKRSIANPDAAAGYLRQSGENIQHISESLSDIVWNIQPQYDDMYHLLVRMKRYAADMLEGANIRYELHFPETATAFELSMEKRRDFYLLFKETINNLVKYARADKAVVQLTLSDKLLQLRISDNGIGFDPQTARQGNGLRNMQHRAHLLQAQLRIDTKPGQGVSVTLEVPL